MLITKRQEKSLHEISKPLGSIISSIKEASNDGLPKVLNSNLTWDTSKGTLLTWIDVLNKFDSILESVVNKYKLADEDAKPTELDAKDTELVVSILDFTYMLLDNSQNKSAYSSSHRLYDLLNSPTIPVIKGVLKCFVVLGKKYSVKSMRRAFVATRKVSDRVYPLALLLPASTVASNTSGDESHSLIDFIRDTAQVPKKWKNLEHTYYPESEYKDLSKSSNQQQQQPEASSITNSPSVKRSRGLQQNTPTKNKKQQKDSRSEGAKPEGASVYYLPESEIRKLSLQQIYDKGAEKLPNKTLYKFCLKAILAKAFNSSSYENLKLRRDLVIIKVLAVALLVSVNGEFEVTSRIFEADPNLLNAVIELNNLGNSAPADVRLAAIQCLDCISSLKTWSSEILRNFGGSISHGLLFQNLRTIVKQIKENDPNIDQEFNAYYLNVLSNLAEVKSLAAMLVSSGLIQTLSEFLTLKTDHKKTLSAATHLLNTVVSISSDYVTAFREINGFSKLIEIIGYEIDFAIANPGYGGGPPKLTLVHFSISFKQANYIRSLLKFVHSLIQSESGDRVRNLFDSPLLGHLNTILQNINVFGFTLLTLSINIISAIIHNEPTSYSILKEAKTIDLIVENFDKYLGKSSDLITSLPNVIGAIALNTEGLEKVKKGNLIHKFFEVFNNNDYAKSLVIDDVSDFLGSAVDELARHYPDLKPEIIDEVVALIKRLPGFAAKHLPRPRIYTSESGSLYHSKEDKVIDNEAGSSQIDAWETLNDAYIIENAAVFIGNLIQYSNSWILIMDKLAFEDWLPLLTLENSSYDYVYSNSMYPVNGVLKYFDDERREYAPRILITEIAKQVESVSDFSVSTEAKSLFQLYEGDAAKSDDLLNRIIAVNNILFAFVDVYCNQTTLSPTRVGQLARFFSDEKGLILLQQMGELLKRVTHEEEAIRSTLPDSVAKETVPNLADEGIPPLRIVTGKEKPEPVFNKTSAKFKNTLQLRFLFNRIHGSIAVIFNTLLTLPTTGRQDTSIDLYRGFTVLISSQITHILSNYLTDIIFKSPAFLLVALDTIWYCLMDANSGRILTIAAINFIQNEGFIRQRDILLQFWPQLCTLPEDRVKELSELSHTVDTSDSITFGIVSRILDGFTMITRYESLASVSNGPLYYEGDLSGSVNIPANNLSASFLVQSKLLGFGVLSGILDEDHFGSVEDGGKLPDSIVSSLIKLGGQLYSSSGEKHLNFSDGALYKLDWRQAKDSRARNEYLQSLGLEEDISSRIVRKYGGDLSVVQDESLPEASGLNADDWKITVARARANPYTPSTPTLVDPQYLHYHTLTDLDDIRQSKSDYFLDQFLLLAQLYPKSVSEVSEFLISSFLGSPKHNVVNFEANIIHTILEYLYSFEVSEKDSQELSSMFELFKLLLQNDVIFYGASSSLKNFSTFVMESLKPEYGNCDWFAEALSGLQRLLAASILPQTEKLEHAMVYQLPKAPQAPFTLDAKFRENLFELLINVNDLTNYKSALAISKTLLVFSRDSTKSDRILKSSLIQKIVKVISTATYNEKEKPYALQSSFILLVRSCFETQEIIRSLVSREIHKQFTSKSRNDNKMDRIRDLASIIKESTGIIVRSPDIYVEELTKHARFNDFAVPLKNLNVRFYDNKDEDVAMIDAQTGEKLEKDNTETESSTTLENQTGIVHLLLTELMTTAKKDWMSEPPLSEKEQEEQKKDKEKNELPKAPKVDVNKNDNCRYMLYLLKVIIELLASYKQSKLEFLTFSKKQLFQSENDEGSLKPRSTSLNFFLHQLIQSSVSNLTDPSDIRKRSVSELASKVIVSFVSSIDQSELKADPKKVDPDMMFIRKFTIDSILKVVKDVTLSSQTMNHRYKKLISVSKLIPLLLSTSRDKLVEESTVEFDGFHVAKTMIEANLPQALTAVLTEIDVNYPEYYFVLDSLISSLKSIASAKSKFQDLFKEYQPNAAADEEELEEDENDFKEETPDLFRNSTLGMYDVDEIDSEEDISDYDEEFDEDDPDRSLQIVYSEDEDEEEDEEDDEDIIDSDDVGSIDDEGDTELGEDDHQDDNLLSDRSFSNSDDEMDIGSDDYASGEILSEGEIDDGDVSNEDEGEFGGDPFVDFESDSEIASELESELDGMVGEEDDEHYDDTSDERPSDNNGNLGVFIHVGEVMNDEDSDDSSSSDILEVEHQHTFLSNERNRRRPTHRHSARRIFNVDNYLEGHEQSLLRAGIERATSQLTTSQLRGISQLNQFESLLNRESLRRVLHPGGIINKSSDAETTLKSTRDRWSDINLALYQNTQESFRVIPSVINRIFAPSEQLYGKQKAEEEEKKKKEEEETRRKRQQEEERQKAEEERRLAERIHASATEVPAQTEAPEQEPVYVMIGEREVDIAGTDIDPEFFEALPDYMREEVFTQHVRERRAQASTAENGSREIDQDFLDALPDTIREEILAQEAMSHRFPPTGVDHEEEEEEGVNTETATGNGNGTSDRNKKEKQKTFFTPLVDRFGVASLIRFVFVPQSFQGRRSLYELLGKICINKQSRAEVLGYLIAILQDGLADQQALERTFHQICSRAKATANSLTGVVSSTKPTTPKTPNTPSLGKSNNALNHFPIRATPFIVAGQILEVLQFLLESDPHLRYYFLSEHEPVVLTKKSVSAKSRKDGWTKQSKYPLNSLLALLDRGLVKEKSVLMDLLSRIIQITTRPLNALQKAHDEKAKTSNESSAEKSKKNLELPSVLDSSFSNVVTILTSDDCSSRTFQQTLSAMQNLLVLKKGHRVFASELSAFAIKLGKVIISDLSELIVDLNKYKDSQDLGAEAMIKFTSSSSDQSKLLRVLTALDYLFGNIEDKESTEIKELTELYKKLSLGPLWGALSDCLHILESNKNITHTATALLPLIEALMVVCKHSKVKELQAKDALKYENKKCDFVNEPIESLFFSFTDTHKKILNQMVRSNAKLMSGPFSMLVRNPRVLEFDNKKNYFDGKLHSNEDEKQSLPVAVRRDQVFLDSYRALFFKSSDEFRKAKLDISFKGEQGVDAGGVTREWYQVLSRQMFNADYALFLPVASDKTTFHPNRTSWVNPEHLSFFKFIGRIIGKAIFDNCFLDCHFSRDVYKSILGRAVSLKDLETIDLEYFNSLMWMLENDITDVIIETFSVETEDYGAVETVDLIPDGRNIAVTEQNKQDYVRLVVEYRLQKSVKEQMDNFLQGFHEIIPKELIAIFDEQELELLISGLPDIDVDDWKNNTNYVNYSPSSKEISYFWRAVRSFDAEERAKLLQFATGTSKVPLNGFKALEGSGDSSKFSIHKDFGSTDRLPSSHTCFNQIDLPAYDSYETLRGSLLLAITEGHEGFGLA